MRLGDLLLHQVTCVTELPSSYSEIPIYHYYCYCHYHYYYYRVMIIKIFLWTKSCAKHFTCVSLFNPYTMRY